MQKSKVYELNNATTKSFSFSKVFACEGVRPREREKSSAPKNALLCCCVLLVLCVVKLTKEHSSTTNKRQLPATWQFTLIFVTTNMKKDKPGLIKTNKLYQFALKINQMNGQEQIKRNKHIRNPELLAHKSDFKTFHKLLWNWKIIKRWCSADWMFHAWCVIFKWNIKHKLVSNLANSKDNFCTISKNINVLSYVSCVGLTPLNWFPCTPRVNRIFVVQSSFCISNQLPSDCERLCRRRFFRMWDLWKRLKWSSKIGCVEIHGIHWEVTKFLLQCFHWRSELDIWFEPQVKNVLQKPNKKKQQLKDFGTFSRKNITIPSVTWLIFANFCYNISNKKCLCRRRFYRKPLISCERFTIFDNFKIKNFWEKKRGLKFFLGEAIQIMKKYFFLLISKKNLVTTFLQH